MIDLIGGPDRDRTDDLFHAMEARSQTAPQAHMLQGMQLFYCLRWSLIRQTLPAIRFKSAPAAGSGNGSRKKNWRDREHLRGVPVSKIMEGVGHRSTNQCPSPTHSEAVLDFQRRLFSRWSEWPQPETGLTPAQIWQMPRLRLLR